MDKIKALKLIKNLDDELVQLDLPGDILLKLEYLKKEIEKEDEKEVSKKQDDNQKAKNLLKRLSKFIEQERKDLEGK